MSCQFTWNLNDYKAKEDKGEDINQRLSLHQLFYQTSKIILYPNFTHNL